MSVLNLELAEYFIRNCILFIKILNCNEKKWLLSSEWILIYVNIYVSETCVEYCLWTTKLSYKLLKHRNEIIHWKIHIHD